MEMNLCQWNASVQMREGMQEKREKERQKEEEKIFRDTMDSFRIPQTVIEKIKSSLSKYKNADKKVQTLLLKKCRPGTKEWWNTLQTLRNIENLNEKEVSKFIGFLDTSLYDDGAAMRKERERKTAGTFHLLSREGQLIPGTVFKSALEDWKADKKTLNVLKSYRI